jgi:YD repeat-containing protein
MNTNATGGATFARTLRATLLACAVAASSALAQEGGGSRLINTPAEKFAMAPGGVDMRTGRYAYSETDLAIGGGEAGGLALTRTMIQSIAGHANPFGNLSHNWEIMISEMRIDADNTATDGTAYQVVVHFGGRSHTYRSRIQDTGFIQASLEGYAPLTYVGDRASPTVVFTYAAADGTTLVFRPFGGGDCSIGRCAYIAEMVEPDGTRYAFDYAPSGESTGGAVRLRRVTSSRGYALLLEGSGHLVTKACVLNLALAPVPADGLCPAAAPTATYTYSVPARLASVTGPDGATASFTYAEGMMGSIATTDMGFVRPGETAPWLVNTFYLRPDEEWNPVEVVARQSFADGQSYDYSFVLGPSVGEHPATIAGGTYTDALGHTTWVLYDWPVAPGANTPGSACTHLPCTLPTPNDPSFVYQQTSGPAEIIDALNRTTRLDYCDPVPMAQLPPTEHNRCIVVPLVSFTDPEGIKTDLQYDDHGNIIRATRHARPGSTQPNGQPWPDIVTSAVYDTSHQKSQTRPLSTTDANGNTTEFTYAPEHGGVLTETGPAPSPGAPRPQTRHEYAQRYAWIANGSGGYVRASSTPIWVPTATSLCRTSAATGNPSAPCGTVGDEVRTAFDYGPDSGPNNLLLRGQTVTSTDNGVTTTLRTCYAYDSLGRRISETQPNANLASCP